MYAPKRPSSAAVPVTRRTLMLAAGGVALLASAGCNPMTSTKTTRTVTATAPPAVDPMDGLIAVTRLHLLRIGAAIAADHTDAAMLKGLQSDRKAHLTALIQEQARTNPAPTTGSTTSAPPPTGSVSVPSEPKLIIPAIRSDAVTAQSQFTDAMGQVSRYRAALFGSIAACLATHRVVLS